MEKEQEDFVFKIVWYIAGYLGHCQTGTMPKWNSDLREQRQTGTTEIFVPVLCRIIKTEKWTLILTVTLALLLTIETIDVHYNENLKWAFFIVPVS